MSGEIFDKVQARLAARASARSPDRHRPPTAGGRGCCGICGGPMRVCRQRTARPASVPGPPLRGALGAQAREHAYGQQGAGAPVPHRRGRGLAGLYARWPAQPPSGRHPLRASWRGVRWRARKLSVSAYGRMEADLQPRIDGAGREAQKALEPIELDVPADGLDVWWNRPRPRKPAGEVVAALIAAVVVHPLKPEYPPRVLPNWIDISWRRGSSASTRSLRRSRMVEMPCRRPSSTAGSSCPACGRRSSPARRGRPVERRRPVVLELGDGAAVGTSRPDCWSRGAVMAVSPSAAHLP